MINESLNVSPLKLSISAAFLGALLGVGFSSDSGIGLSPAMALEKNQHPFSRNLVIYNKSKKKNSESKKKKKKMGSDY